MSKNRKRADLRVGERTHHERIDEEIIVLEGCESGGGDNAILVALAQLQSGHHSRESPEQEKVEQLHIAQDKRRVKNMRVG